MATVPNLSLTTPSGTLEIPQLGFGVWQVPDDGATDAVSEALRVGYRHIDTAAAYRNERGVGRALASTEVAREDIFVTTKVWNDAHGATKTPESLHASLARLGIEELDLFLIHWPAPKQDAYLEAWQALRAARDEGLVKAIGVCNFQVPHLQRLFEEAGEWPAINQIELHPYLVQSELRAFDAEHGILTEAWSPLASGGGVLTDEVIVGVASAHGVTPAQAILRWHLQLGNVVIPKSVTPSRIAENFDVFGFVLTEQEVAAITALDRGERTGPNPDVFEG